MALDLKNYIASIPDYPEKGIVFRDVTPLMADGEAYRQATDRIVQFAKDKGVEMVVCPEARGFIIGCPVALNSVLVLRLQEKPESSQEKRLRLSIRLNMVLQRFICIRMQSNRDKKFWS